MLVLRRTEGQWVEITHRSGDRMRIRVYNINGRPRAQLDVAFDDAAGDFRIERPERSSPRPMNPAREARRRTPPPALGGARATSPLGGHGRFRARDPRRRGDSTRARPGS
jgi:hypothetical protein